MPFQYKSNISSFKTHRSSFYIPFMQQIFKSSNYTTNPKHTVKTLTIYGWKKCSPQKVQRSTFLIIYRVYFLWVASHHYGTAARLQMRADGPEPRDRGTQIRSN